MKTLSIFMALIVIGLQMSCGSNGGSAPTVSSVTDANGATIEATSTVGVFPTAFNVAFSESMDDATVIADDAITFECELPADSEMTQPAITVAAHGTEANTYTVTVADAWKYQLMTCALTVTTAVKSSSGTALAANAVYQFTNACAVSDDFNADSQACWTPVESMWSTNYLWTTWSDILTNALSYSPAGSEITYDDSMNDSGAAARNFAIKKTVTVSENGFEIEAHVTEISGFDCCHGTENADNVILFSIVSGASSYGVVIMYMSQPNAPYYIANYIPDNNAPMEAYGMGGGALSGDEYYFKFVHSDDSVGFSYSTDGANWAVIPCVQSAGEVCDGASFPAVDMSGSGRAISIGAAGCGDDHNNYAKIQYIKTSGITSTDQY